MSHVHRVVVLVGVGQNLTLEAFDDLRHRAPFARNFFAEPLRQLFRLRREDAVAEDDA